MSVVFVLYSIPAAKTKFIYAKVDEALVPPFFLLEISKFKSFNSTMFFEWHALIHVWNFLKFSSARPSSVFVSKA